MNLVRKAAVAASAIYVLLLLSGCGSNFRPLATIIPQQTGNPALLDTVAVLNQNSLPLDADGVTIPVGSFTLIDVSGDTNSGDFKVGFNTQIPVPPAAPSLQRLITFANGNSQVATVDLDAKTVTVQSTTSGPLTVSLPTGATPNSIAATTNTGLILVSLQGDTDPVDSCSSHGAVAIIQAGTASRLSPSICMLTANPGFILVLPGDQKALVLDSTNNNATFINIPNATAGTTVSVGTNPVWATSNATSSSNASTVYVLNQGSGTISVVDVAGETVTATSLPAVTGSLSSPSMIVFDGTLSRLYISNTGASPGTVSVLDTTQLCPGATCLQSLHAAIQVGTAPIALAVTPGGSKVYVANTGEASASVINTTTFAASKITVTIPGTTLTATWLTVSKDGTRAYLTLVDPADVGSGTAIIITASNLPLTDPNNGNAPVLIAPTPQDLTSACVVYGPPSNCATVGKQRPVQIVPRL